ncbi:MAG: AAA family ATPase [Flavobacteriaceae bacterium]
MRPKKIVITGGPSTGKTSVINALEELGHICFEEVIRAMTRHERETGGGIAFTSNPIISVDNPMAFNKRILDARISDFHEGGSLSENWVFFDRGIPDVVAYMACFGQEYGPTFEEACQTLRYDTIFIMPPWKEIHINDAQRFESFEEGEKVYTYLMEAYQRYGYSPILVPTGSIGERTTFILEHLKGLDVARP